MGFFLVKYKRLIFGPRVYTYCCLRGFKDIKCIMLCLSIRIGASAPTVGVQYTN